MAVVAGGTGEIGEGVVRAFLSNGYRVYVPERQPGNADRLKANCADRAEQLVTLTADLGFADQVQQFAHAVVELAEEPCELTERRRTDLHVVVRLLARAPEGLAQAL